MHLLKMKTSEHKCLLYCAAMVLGTTVKSLEDLIGYTGMEKIHPDLEEPFCFRGIHIQEIQYCFFAAHKALIEWEPMPRLGPDEDHSISIYTEKQSIEYLNKFLGKTIGILASDTHHAVAWDGNNVYDPNGIIKTIDDFEFRAYYFVTQLI